MSETQGLSPFFAPQPVPLFTRPSRSRWMEYGRPALLFVVTAACICVTGSILFMSADLQPAWRDGFILVAAVSSIMIAHEMGHYVACRYYGVDASLPHFLPVPPIFYCIGPPLLVSLIGTFGAFIRIRGPIPHRRALFDIGVAGPLAGFVVTVAVLLLAFLNLSVVPASDAGESFLNGPLLIQLASHFVPVPAAPTGMIVAVSAPLYVAAWFGLFLTALNLMPVGQLDGGHVIYALLTRYAHHISRIAMWASLALIYFSPSWILWCVLMRVLLGRPHPPTLDDEAPVGPFRAVVGIITLLIFVFCFQPQPIVVSWSELYLATRELIASKLT